MFMNLLRKKDSRKMQLITLMALLSLLLSPRAVLGFCGFYVAKADTKLFNKASQVVLVRHEDKTVLTMANDYQGDLKEFAIVIPVPTFLERDQIHVGDKALLDHLDAYSAPRLVEYFDEDPCAPRVYDGPRKEPRRDRRGALHDRRVRHPHPFGQGEHGPGDVAHTERVPDPAG